MRNLRLNEIMTLDRKHLGSGILIGLWCLFLFAVSCGQPSTGTGVVDAHSVANGHHNDGVPLDNIGRSKSADTLGQTGSDNSGVAMDNINRDTERDTANQPRFSP